MRVGTLIGGIVLAVVGFFLLGIWIPVPEYVNIPFLGRIQYGTNYIVLEPFGWLFIFIGIIVAIAGAVIPSSITQVQVQQQARTIRVGATGVGICPFCGSQVGGTDKFCRNSGRTVA
jgi:hypothetical protein